MISKIYISYSQVAVFKSGMQSPFNEWSEKQYSQGFAWRNGSVSFRSIVDAGYHALTISLLAHMPPIASDTVRAIDVPFFSEGEIEVASISDGVIFPLPGGEYQLRCEFSDIEHPSLRLIFVPASCPEFGLVRTDPGLSPLGDLEVGGARVQEEQ